MNIKPYTELETLEIMMCETQNELHRLKLTDRLMIRQKLAGTKNDQIIAMNQGKMRVLTQSLKDLLDIKTELIAKEEKIAV